MPKPKRGALLVVDDEVELLRILCESLSELGFDVKGVSSPAKALEAIREMRPDILLSDLTMPHTDGIALLKFALTIDPNLIGIIMTGQGSTQTLDEAMKSGAFDYMVKPFRIRQALPVLERAMEVRRLRLENICLKRLVLRLRQAQGDTIRVEDLPEDLGEAPAHAGPYNLEAMERRQIQLVLNEMKGNKVHAAKALGVSRRTLYRLIEKHDLEPVRTERESAPDELTPSAI
jgi:DNA-binding NtrC family response regulator